LRIGWLYWRILINIIVIIYIGICGRILVVDLILVGISDMDGVLITITGHVVILIVLRQMSIVVAILIFLDCIIFASHSPSGPPDRTLSFLEPGLDFFSKNENKESEEHNPCKCAHSIQYIIDQNNFILNIK